MLAIPEKETGSKSLRMLSSLSEKLMQVEFREALLYLERTKFPFFRRKVRDDRAEIIYSIASLWRILYNCVIIY